MNRLLADAAALIDVASVSHHEQDIADLVETRLRSLGDGRLEVHRIANNVLARSNFGRPSRLVLAGHLDTVPPNGNDKARVVGDTLWGLGASDMKGGLSVMLDLAASLCQSAGAGARQPAFDVTFVFYSCEEVDRSYSGLLEIEAASPGLLAGDAAILGEPTGSYIEAGCQGVLKACVTFVGTRAHTARPWMGSNAIHRSAGLLTMLASYEERRPVIDGCEYREALQAVKFEAGVAGNVVPDRATVVLNHRYAPDRTDLEAEEALRRWIEPSLDQHCGDSVGVVDRSPSAAPNLAHPALSSLVKVTGKAPRAKLGWTDVAFFAERGIPAVNFGPGHPELAHTKDEYVTLDELVTVRDAIAVLLEIDSP